MMKAKVLRRMTSEDSDGNETNSNNKENIDTNRAAVVIQSRKYKHINNNSNSILIWNKYSTANPLNKNIRF